MSVWHSSEHAAVPVPPCPPLATPPVPPPPEPPLRAPPAPPAFEPPPVELPPVESPAPPLLDAVPPLSALVAPPPELAAPPLDVPSPVEAELVAPSVELFVEFVDESLPVSLVASDVVVAPPDFVSLPQAVSCIARSHAARSGLLATPRSTPPSINEGYGPQNAEHRAQRHATSTYLEGRPKRCASQSSAELASCG